MFISERDRIEQMIVSGLLMAYFNLAKSDDPQKIEMMLKLSKRLLEIAKKRKNELYQVFPKNDSNGGEYPPQ